MKSKAEETKTWSAEIVATVTHTHNAHSGHANAPEDGVRFHDGMTPYIVHPLWCAAALLQEPGVSQSLRRDGYAALLWHDTLEDTDLPLPSDTSRKIANWVKDMTFESFEQEKTALWERPIEIRLLKLYDKVSNLLDGDWMKTGKWNAYVDHTLRLANDVEKNFGMLNIVKIARAIAVHK